MRDNINLFISGKNITLVPYCQKHVEKYHGWMQDPWLLELTASEHLTLEEEYEMQNSWREDKNKCTFIVLTKLIQGRNDEISQMIGDVNIFLNIEDDLSKAELDVMIAQAEFRGHGYGKEIVLLMIHYCITRLNILSFYCKINKKNHSSLKLFQSLGFEEVKFIEAFQEYELVLNLHEDINHLLLNNLFLEKLNYSIDQITYGEYDENSENNNDNNNNNNNEDNI